MNINFSNINLKEDFSRSDFDKIKFTDHCEEFFQRLVSNIHDLLGKSLDSAGLNYGDISINCLIKFATFWQEKGVFAPATYFTCPSIVHSFKNYKKYVIQICNEHRDDKSVDIESVRVVLVTTIWSMINLEKIWDGKLDAGIISWKGEKTEIQLRRLLERIELPPTSPILRVPPKKLSGQVPTITQKDLDDNFERFGWEDMEHLVGKLFEKKGYAVTITPPTGDFGIDVEARNNSESIGIQVKHWSKDVGYEDIAKTLGSSMGKFNKSIIINSKAGFTSQALQKQSEMPFVLELWDVSKLKNEMRKIFLNNQSGQGWEGGFCTQCGVKNIKNSKFCHKCGTKLIEL